MLAVVLGMGARFYRLGEPLWFDEALTVHTALKSFWDIPIDLIFGKPGATPPLFYFILHFWLQFFGDSDFGMHFFTACIGVLGIVAVWRTGAHFAGKTAGLAAAAVMAFHPFHIAASQEVRPYGLLVGLSVLSSYFLWRALNDDKPRDWVLYALASVANLYTHNYAVFLLIAQISWTVTAALRDRTKYSDRAVFSFAVILCGYSPWIPCGLIQFGKDIFGFIPAPNAYEIKRTILVLSGLWINVGETETLWFPSVITPALITCLSLVACCMYCHKLRQKDIVAYVLFLPTLTLLIPFFISFKKPIYFAGRYTIIALPFVCLFWGAVIESAKSRHWRAAILACCLGIPFFTSYGYFAKPKSYDRDIAAYLVDRHKPGYVIAIFPEFWGLSISRYYGADFCKATSIPRRNPLELPPGVLVVEIRENGPGGKEADILGKNYILEEHKVFGDFAVVKLFLKRDFKRAERLFSGPRHQAAR